VALLAWKTFMYFIPKEADMLLHLPIVILATLSPVAVSDTVPTFDIVKECRFESESTVQFDRCRHDEAAARGQLMASWPQFVFANRSTCTAATMTGGFASYVELLTCLEMARDADNIDSSAGGPQTTEAAPLRAPGVTVGVGQGPITPAQMPDRRSR
jgi:hypothetical protein